MDHKDVKISRIEMTIPPLYSTVRVNTLKISVEEGVQLLQQEVNQQYEDRLEKTPHVYAHPEFPDVLVIQGQGPIKREKCEKIVMVDHCCGCAVLRGAHIFTSGVLAAPPSMQAGDKVSVHVDLEGKCLQGLTKPYPGRTMHIGNGIAKYSRNEIFASEIKPGGIGIKMTEPLYSQPSLSDLNPKLLFPQNLPSIVTSQVLNPQPGQLVLDMCAAPGGKTSHIATLMQNQGRVIALDRSAGKVQKVKAICGAWGLDIVEDYVFDSTKVIHKNADLSGGPPYPPVSFDCVLLDGPCSALGQRPMLVCNMTAKHLASHPTLQKNLFTQAVAALKPGGSLVYSTCTLPAAENEEIVAWALKEFPKIQLVPQTPHLGDTGVQMDSLAHAQTKLLQRFHPVRHQNLCSLDDVTKVFGISDKHRTIFYEEHSMDILSKNDVREKCNDKKSYEQDLNHGSCENNMMLNIRSKNVNNDTIGFFIAKFTKS